MQRKLLKLSLLAAGVMSAAGTQAQGLEEVIVTAQKRAEGLQEVPISVSALSGERFEAIFSAGDDIKALAARVPGLYAESSNGRVAPRFYIRGLGNSDFDLAASQPVSIIFDDVVQENVVLKSFPIFDVEQVEVVRGPQGTLFGRNTTAGVVKFASRKPTRETEGYGKAALGQLGTLNLEGAVGGSLTDDGDISGRVAVLRQQRDDYIANSFTDEIDALGGFREQAARAQVLFEPTDDFSALVNFHVRDFNGTSSIFRANVLTQGQDGDLNSNFDRDRINFNGGDNNPQEYNNRGGSVKLNYDLDGVIVESITAYEEAQGRSRGDIDGGAATLDFDGNPIPGGPGFIPFDSDTQDSADTDQITQEIRFASDTSDALQWQAGAFYFDSDLEVTTDPGFTAPTTVRHENETYSVFGQLSYDVTDAFSLTGGLRWTYDERSFSVLTRDVEGIDVDDDQISWELSANYRLDDFNSIFARVAEGFRAQSIQGRDVAFFGQPSVADSETVLSWELGYKGELIENTLRVNLTGFFYEIDDIQLTAVGGGGNFNRLLNAEQGVGQGFEFDFEWLATENLILTLGGSFNDTEIEDADLTTAFCGNGCTVTDPIITAGDGTQLASIDGNPFQNSPEIVANFTLRYSFPINDVSEFYVFTDWAYQGETSLALYEAREFTIDNQFEGGLRLGYINNEHDYEVAFFGRNITDEENILGQVDFNNLTAFTNEPRVLGIELSKNF